MRRPEGRPAQHLCCGSCCQARITMGCHDVVRTILEGQPLELEQGSLVIHILVSSRRYGNSYGKGVTERKSSSLNDDHWDVQQTHNRYRARSESNIRPVW